MANVYCEDPNFVPNPTDIAHLVRTDGVSGIDHNVSTHAGVFAVAEERRKIVAARALDPNSPIDRGLVVLPGGTGGEVGTSRTDDEVRAVILAQAVEVVSANPEALTADLRDGDDIAADVLADADVEAAIEAAVVKSIKARAPRTPPRPVPAE